MERGISLRMASLQLFPRSQGLVFNNGWFTVCDFCFFVCKSLTDIVIKYYQVTIGNRIALSPIDSRQMMLLYKCIGTSRKYKLYPTFLTKHFANTTFMFGLG